MSDIDALLERLQMQSNKFASFAMTLIAYGNAHPESINVIRPIVAELQPDVQRLSMLSTQPPSSQLIQAYQAILTPLAAKMLQWRAKLPVELQKLVDSL